MKRATMFMIEKVSHRGGYVWSYLPDFSRRWGELEARETMIWIQPPGTATVGHLFLDAYHATRDEYYYAAAEQVAAALTAAQHPSGGWNYVYDFAGENSLRDWYATVGRNAWRLEEFHHYYGNATFDDGGTAEATKFLLRLYVEKRDPRHKPAFDRALQFTLDAQYPNGAWPQRFPLSGEFSRDGAPPYPAYLTFNDDVAAENIDVLLLCHQALGGERLLEPIHRAMHSFLVTQLSLPQPGWALQYTPDDLQPAAARSYEPRALMTQGTAENIDQLLKFYRLTGETKYLARIPEALSWLEACELPSELKKSGATHPTWVELGTNRPLYVHRRGSNVFNGRYFVDTDPGRTIVHYSSFRHIDTAGLRRRYEQTRDLPIEEATKDSPLLPGRRLKELPRYFTARTGPTSDPNDHNPRDAIGAREQLSRVLASLNEAGYWPTRLHYTSNPFSGDGSATPPSGDFSQTLAGDHTDTSPYRNPEVVLGISTPVYIRNMNVLIQALDEAVTSGGAR
jgi:PelA/Pel-15E family pectate lyase